MTCFTASTLRSAGVALAGLLLAQMPADGQAPKVVEPAEAKNMRLVGFNDLQARSAYQPTIHKQGDRYIAYVGHHGASYDGKPANPLKGVPEFNGTSIVDVTDPVKPKYLAHIPGAEGGPETGGAQMTRVCDGRSLPRGDANAVYLLRSFGRLAHEIWNVADPANPKLVVRIGGDYKDTHKSWWECDTGIAFLVSGVPGWRAQRMLEIYDLGDPSKPVKIRDFGLPGHEPGATGAVPSDLHGPISTGPQGNRLYLAYGPLNGGIFQIIDRQKLLQGPKEPTPANLRYPEVGRLDMSPLHGAHTVRACVVPQRHRDFQGLRALGERFQVLCITHLPQVAAAASHHFVVTKEMTDHRTRTLLVEASGKSREEEIARMLGGQSKSALGHARTLLKAEP
jgi:hypothetical protein